MAHPSRVDFLKFVLKDAFDKDNLELLSESCRVTTVRQYESIWKTFCKWARVKDILNININSVISFLKFLFKEKSFETATILTYKAGLREPLETAFDLDFDNKYLKQAARALALKNPAKSIPTISWSISNSLKAIHLGLSFGKNDIVIQTLRTSFLLSLAMGSRISELHALRRDNIKFFNGFMVLHPHPLFLKKNENPLHRSQPIRIQGLPEGNLLCPIFNVKRLICLTKTSKSTALFVNDTSLQPISKKKLAEALCLFIKLTNPSSFPKSHDVRKVASSLSFMACTSLEEVCDYTGWRSGRVFFNHYFKHIKDLISNVVVLGQPIN